MARKIPSATGGDYYDSESGLYYLQSRYYDPNTGRFLNADGQLNPSTGNIGMNLFAYCNNNPMRYSDPDGRRMLAFGGNESVVVNGNKNVVLSKKMTERPDTGMRGFSDEEVSRRARDQSIPGYERKKYQNEEKVRGLRNRQKRDSQSHIVTQPSISPKTINTIISGLGLMTIGIIGTVVLVADDSTIIGVADDWALVGTTDAVVKGVILLFG